MPASKRKTVAEKLISIVSKEVAKIPDYRKRVGPDSISLHDAIMSGLAVMRGGRARWKIENETFNTLKTQDYNLEHNYGHGKQHLATNLACLTLV